MSRRVVRELLESMPRAARSTPFPPADVDPIKTGAARDIASGSSQVVVRLANRDCPANRACRPVTAYIFAAWRLGSDLTAVHLLPVVSTERVSDTVYLFEQPVRRPPCKTIYLRAAELRNHFMMHSFRVGDLPSTFLTWAAVGEIMKIAGWKTKSTAQYKIGATSSGQVDSKRE